MRDASGDSPIMQLTCYHVTMQPSSSQVKPNQTRDLSSSQSVEESTDEEPGGSRRKKRLTVYDAVAGK